MASYDVKKVINETSLAAAVAALPGAFFPGIDLAVVGGLWLRMMTKIAKDNQVIFSEEPIKFVGTVAAGIGAYWTGSRIFSWGIPIVLAFFTGGISLLAIPVVNALLNGYFTFAVGRRMDKIFGAISGTDAGMEIAAQVVKAVCHVPTRSEFGEFWDEIGGAIMRTIN